MTRSKDPAAVALGRKGGLAAGGAGGRAAWARMKPQERAARLDALAAGRRKAQRRKRKL